MKIWTAHEKPDAPPVMVREGFSFAALFFGPFWLAANRAWAAAGTSFVIAFLILFFARPPASSVLMAGLALLLGFSGQDLVRWSITRRGYIESNVVTGRDEDEARVRLLDARPDLVERSMMTEATP